MAVLPPRAFSEYIADPVTTTSTTPALLVFFFAAKLASIFAFLRPPCKILQFELSEGMVSKHEMLQIESLSELKPTWPNVIENGVANLEPTSAG